MYLYIVFHYYAFVVVALVITDAANVNFVRTLMLIPHTTIKAVSNNCMYLL